MLNSLLHLLEFLLSCTIIHNHRTTCICIVHTELISSLFWSSLTHYLVVIRWLHVDLPLNSTQSLNFSFVIILLLGIFVRRLSLSWLIWTWQTCLTLLNKFLILLIAKLTQKRRVKQLLELLLIILNLICWLVSLLLRFSKNSWILHFRFRLIFQLSSWSRSLVCIFLDILYLLGIFLLSLLWFRSFIDLNRNVIVIGILILVHHLSTSHSYLVLNFWLYVSQIWWIFTRNFFCAVVILILTAILVYCLSRFISLSVINFFQVVLWSVLYHNYLILWVILFTVSIPLRIFFTLLVFVYWCLI